MLRTVILYVKHFSLLWFKVQSKVNMKYDTWHKEILSKFASRLGDNMQDFYGSVSKVIICFCRTFIYHQTGCTLHFRHCNYFTLMPWYLYCYVYSEHFVLYFRHVLIWSNKQLREPLHLMLLGSSLLFSHWRESWRTGRKMSRSEVFPSCFHTLILGCFP